MTELDYRTLAVVVSQLERARQDMNEIAAANHDNEHRLVELSKELNILRDEVLKYKWISYGVMACLSAAGFVLNYIGFDYFSKKGG